MKEIVSQMMTDAATNTKVAATVGSATGLTGAATWLSIMPQIIGVAASLAGLVLTVILAIINVRKHLLEYEILKEKLRNKDEHNRESNE